ncbi:MAG: hypothetical protein ACT4QE_08245 [Anaerolineales bacterium]
MRTDELAEACALYSQHGAEYDRSYGSFLRSVYSSLDLNNSLHAKALLRWLNQWDCRQFARDYHDLAADEILRWHGEYSDQLFAQRKNIWELTDRDIHAAKNAYAALRQGIASFRKKKGKTSVETVRIGSTGAAKILFAVRPLALAPWDNSIRKKLKYDGEPDSYREYLQDLRRIATNLRDECEQAGFLINELPARLGRPLSTVPKLIDEYNWITLTKQLLSQTEL